jgi:hypothetical protein
MLMPGAPSRSGHPPGARSRPHAATPAPSRATIRKAHEHRRAVIITCSILMAAVATAATVIATASPTSWHSVSLPQTATATAPKDTRNAKITIASESGACSQQTFDNKTGRLSRTQQPCEAVTYDNDGFPVDPGAIRRFNELKKSFSNH